jgi:cell wall-associated NlpC family hydrolase
MLAGSSRLRRDPRRSGAWRWPLALPRASVALLDRALALLGLLVLLAVASPAARAMATPAESVPLVARAVPPPVATAYSPSRSVALTAMHYALAQVGKRYRWGGNGPNAYDCSGLTSMAYHSAGVAIPRVSRFQYANGRHVPVRWLAAGDLVFYASDTARPATVHHVGLYLGNGRMVEAANPRAPIRVASIWRPGLMAFGVRPAPETPRMLPVRLGQRGVAVAAIQARLHASGQCLAVDGAFGPITLASVRRFQRAHGIAPAGIVGPRTWAALAGSGRQQRRVQSC